MTKESKEEKFIKQVFNHFGYNLKKVDESETKSPDFLTSDKGFTILLELKTKNENGDILDARKKALDDGEIYSKSTSLARNNNISKLVQKAAKQLSAKKDIVGADFCFVILHANGVASSYHLSQFEASIYGSVNLITYTSPSEPLKPCYYFYNSDFFNHRDIIDGAFLVGENNLQFCLNDLSPRYELVKQSGIFALFESGTIDPVEKENSGKAYSVRAAIDRSSENTLLEHIIEKYALKNATPFNFAHQMLITRVSDEQVIDKEEN